MPRHFKVWKDTIKQAWRCGRQQQQQRLGKRTEAPYMYSGDEAITDVPNDDDHELFEDDMEKYDTKRETTRT